MIEDIFKRCHRCNEVMTGIRSYEIRVVCEECGGKSLVSKDKDEKKQ